jgi:ubiquitin C-terminal hydrolase
MVKLINLSNTCAINSLIQSILLCDINIDLFLKPSVNTFSSNFLEFLIFLNNNNNETIEPNNFIETFFKHFTIFKKGEQLDAQEVWTYISNTIVKDTSYNININKIFTNNLDKQAFDEINLHNNNKNSEWNNLFQGVFIYINICNTCKNKTYKFEPFYSINMNCNKSIIEILIDYFKRNTKEEIIFKCHKCDINKIHNRYTKFYSLAKYLIISINRYNNIGEKINLKIKVNKSINLTSNILINNKKNIVLNLVSCLCHYGNINNGHYININIKDKIINDDSNIINIENMDELLNNNSNCYILFYKINYIL